jgi:hypothetical protein
MNPEELNQLTIEQLQEVFCDFYNDIDKLFYNNRQCDVVDSMIKNNMLTQYIQSSRKVLQSIKK